MSTRMTCVCWLATLVAIAPTEAQSPVLAPRVCAACRRLGLPACGCPSVPPRGMHWQSGAEWSRAVPPPATTYSAPPARWVAPTIPPFSRPSPRCRRLPPVERSWGPACPPPAPCGDDACLQYFVPPAPRHDPGFEPAGVHSLLSVFEAAAARGVENAMIRAFNSRRVCPTCQPQPPWDPCHDAPPGLQPPLALPRPASYPQTDHSGLHAFSEPRQFPAQQQSHHTITGITPLFDTTNARHPVDPPAAGPPQGVWWNASRGRLETTDAAGNEVAFGDPAAPDFRFGRLIETFRIELDVTTKQVKLTHRQSRQAFVFAARR